MNSKETSLKTTTSLIEELSDEEAGACVGGLHIDIDLLDNIINGVVGSTSVEVTVGDLGVGYDSQQSLRGGGGTIRSDRNQKEHFAPVDVQEILTKVVTLPIETWNYKDQNPACRHIGPMAQGFAAAFNVGEDNRFINTVDANGVVLAAIQALYKLLQEKDAAIGAMRAELHELKQQMVSSKVETSIAMPVAALNHN
jgi:hypothetical protein